MKEHDRHMALLAAAVALDWLTERPPHMKAHPSRYAAALHSADTAHLTYSGGSGGGPGPVNEISDPTGNAAIKGTANGISVAMRELAGIVAETAWAIRDDVTLAVYGAHLLSSPTGLTGARRDVAYVMTIPHHAQSAVSLLRSRDLFEDAEQLDTSIDVLARSARDLKSIAFTAFGGVTRTEAETPKQRAMVGCASCRRDNNAWEPIDPRYPTGGLCRWCKDVLTTYGRRPTVQLVARHREGRRISAGEMTAALGQPKEQNA